LENACVYIKKVLQKVPVSLSSIDMKEALVNKLDEFVNTKINTKQIIAYKKGINLIKENDCILVYGKSQIFRNILKEAAEKEIKFRVVYVDNRQNNHSKLCFI
jgi:translation initiation factor 2B subunit (eIF-2B alpha/beta/delta family)